MSTQPTISDTQHFPLHRSRFDGLAHIASTRRVQSASITMTSRRFLFTRAASNQLDRAARDFEFDEGRGLA
jgi:hypothetical protein